jgi:hypothetical protein
MEDFIKSKIGAIALSALLAFGLMATIVYFTRGENKIHIYLPAVFFFGIHRYLRKDQTNNKEDSDS